MGWTTVVQFWSWDSVFSRVMRIWAGQLWFNSGDGIVLLVE